MNPLPNDWLALLAVVYTLGLKHGMDPDHLATIDGIARSNAARNPRLARWSGFLFSAGHGATVVSARRVMVIAAGMNRATARERRPGRLFAHDLAEAHPLLAVDADRS